MKKLSLTSIFACFLFSVIFIVVGCAKNPSAVLAPAAEKKAEVKKPQAEEVSSGQTYEEIPSFRRFFRRSAQ